MKFWMALCLAAGVHAIAFLVLWRSWPPPAPVGEVVPLELRAVEPPPPPPPPPPEPAAAGGAAKAVKRPQKMVLALQPAAGEPAAPPPKEAANSDGITGSDGTSSGGTGGTGGGGTGGGSGGTGGGSGGTGGAVGPGAAFVDHTALRAQAMERIRQQRRYPELVRRRHIEGTVIVAFRVAADGSVTSLRVKKSVDAMLDEAALDAVRSAAPLPPALSSDGELEVPFRFSLRD